MAFASLGQNEDVIGKLSAVQFNGKILLSWNIQKGYTCNGITIERSLDSLNFEPVGSIEGVCGSATAVVEYDFTDISPELNSINYYRLLLGGVGYSWVVSENIIDISSNGFVMAPNPVENQAVLYFENGAQLGYNFKIINAQGVVVHSEVISTDEIDVDVHAYQSGIYFFLLEGIESSTILRGKFLVK
jgi:hypothetical protein